MFSQYVTLRRICKKHFLQKFILAGDEISFWSTSEERKDVKKCFLCIVLTCPKVWDLDFQPLWHRDALCSSYQKDFLINLTFIHAAIFSWVVLSGQKHGMTKFCGPYITPGEIQRHIACAVRNVMSCLSEGFAHKIQMSRLLKYCCGLN